MNLYDLIGYSGVLVASISLIPQIQQILNTKKVRDLNRCYFLLMVMSEFLYISYGFVKEDYVMVASTIPPIANSETAGGDQANAAMQTALTAVSFCA